MSKAWATAVMVTGISLVAGAGCAEMDKHESLASTPSAVQQAITGVAGNQKVEKIEKETEDGKTVYEVSFDSKTGDRTVTFSEAGEILEDETEVKVADLPPAVSAAVLKAQPLARVKEAESVKKGGQTYYEIDAKVGEDKHELSVTPDGQLLKDKVEEDDEHHDGDWHGHEKKGEDKD